MLLSLFAFGSSTSEVAVFGLASYVAMVASRKYCGYVVFAGSFAYLIYYHATSASGEAWKAGNIDITGLLMVLTLKVTACALNFQDSLLPESEKSDFQKRRAVTQLPDILEYASWLMFPCTLVRRYALSSFHSGACHVGDRHEPRPRDATLRHLILFAKSLCLLFA